eukprot:TRINITY_DN1573_c0_g1_i1.p1 TRINITY_DN1573_c0_g1~~TRINITY_DN1573_c0_g1_i1.p1  ORF type:complete len:164 (-),score=34.99 TRINITY_DN1573_c0_g1_i1:9-500(-)
MPYHAVQSAVTLWASSALVRAGHAKNLQMESQFDMESSLLENGSETGTEKMSRIQASRMSQRPWYWVYQSKVKTGIFWILVAAVVFGFVGDKYYSWKATKRRQQRQQQPQRNKRSEARNRAEKVQLESDESIPVEELTAKRAETQKVLTEAVRSVMRERRPKL